MSRPHFFSYINFSCFTVMVIGMAVLAGYMFKIDELISIHSSLSAMNPLTAILLIIISNWVLILLYWKMPRPLALRILLVFIPITVFAIAFRRIVEISFSYPFVVDKIFFESQTGSNRMAAATSINFLLLSISMFAGKVRFRGGSKVFHFSTIFSLALSLISIFGYIVGSNSAETTKPFAPMALHTTICFILLGLSMLLLFPKYSFIKNLISSDLGGHSARKLIPYAVIVPTGLAYLRFTGERLDLYDPGFGLALQVVSTTIIFLFLIWREARSLNKIDRRRKEVELTIEQRSRELSDVNKSLERSNYELEQFAYVASHDLQEPLRKIQTFADILQTRATGLDEKGKQHLERIVRASGRMSSLVQDLLTFSRLIDLNDRLDKLDLNKIAGNVVNDYEIMLEEKQATIEVEKLPEIEGIHFQINQLFYNLVNNALKFVSAATPPYIKIDCQPAEQKMVEAFNLRPDLHYFHLKFKDNGIGFDPKNAQRIFQMFQRLPQSNPFAGSGIGLALCKKIVLNHQGEIFGESEPGKGSIFHVLLPEKQGHREVQSN